MILASQSPRRRELLSIIVLDFRVIPPHVDERPLGGETPSCYVERLAKAKAMAVCAEAGKGENVIGSDTTVSVDGKILNKPVDQSDFLRMMRLLSGRKHQVYSGVCVFRDFVTYSCVVRTDVQVRIISDREARDYWASGEPKDKAGGYGIQGSAARFIERIDGSYTNVVGLPLVELEVLLNDAS